MKVARTNSNDGIGVAEGEGGFSAAVVGESHPLIKNTGLDSNQSLHASEGHLRLLSHVVTPHQSLQLHQPLQRAQSPPCLFVHTPTKLKIPTFLFNSNSSWKPRYRYLMMLLNYTHMPYRSSRRDVVAAGHTYQVSSKRSLNHNCSVVVSSGMVGIGPGGEASDLHSRLRRGHCSFCSCHRNSKRGLRIRCMLRARLRRRLGSPENPSPLLSFLRGKKGNRDLRDIMKRR